MYPLPTARPSSGGSTSYPLTRRDCKALMPSKPCGAAAGLAATLPSLGKEVVPTLEICRTEPAADSIVVEPLADELTISSISCSAKLLTRLADMRVLDSRPSQITPVAARSAAILRGRNLPRSQEPLPEFD